jgi:RHS repeat-associated protein
VLATNTFALGLVARWQPTGATHPLTDALGSVRARIDDAGDVVATSDYLAFGELLAGDPPDPYGFTGQRLDAETGLYHLRARQYDPGLGRLLSVDPVTGSLADPTSRHPYLYARDNPLTYADPTGQTVSLAQVAFTNFAISFAISAIFDIAFTNKTPGQIVGGAVISGIVGAIAGPIGDKVGGAVLGRLTKMGTDAFAYAVRLGIARFAVAFAKASVSTILNMAEATAKREEWGFGSVVFWMAGNLALEWIGLGGLSKEALGAAKHQAAKNATDKARSTSSPSTA